MKISEDLFNFNVKKTLTRDQMDDILTTAIEGGIGYWACLLNDDPAWIKAEKQQKAEGGLLYWSSVALRVMENGDAVKFVDAEEDPDDPDLEVWKLTLDKLMQGCALFEQERGSITKMLNDGSFDAIEADCLIQYAVFGKIIFG